MMEYHTGYRSVGSLRCLTGRCIRLWWQCHDIGIAGGVGEWFYRPSRNGVCVEACHGYKLPESGHLETREIASATSFCVPGMCMTQTLILCWAAQKYNSRTRTIIFGSVVEPFSQMSTTAWLSQWKRIFRLAQWVPHVWTAMSIANNSFHVIFIEHCLGDQWPWSHLSDQ